MSPRAFTSLPLRPELLAGINSLHYAAMTPIQSRSLPVILNGTDVLAQAQSGSGKTAAFAIGLLNQIVVQTCYTQALVICPTRELSEQVSEVIRQFARLIPNLRILALRGGKSIRAQRISLEQAPHIVVGTPGRLLKHLDQGALQLSRLEVLVLDEADRMLDMGFYEDIMRIIAVLPSQRQTLLFSATYPDEIRTISNAIQRVPLDIRLVSSCDQNQIEQIFYSVNEAEKTSALVNLLYYYQPQSCLVFCNHKQLCHQLAKYLTQQSLNSLALHGDMEQFERDEVLVQFLNQSSPILIATDVAARGLDIKDLEVVINYELSQDQSVHFHRIGRTGRAGCGGLAISLVLPREEGWIEAMQINRNSPVKYGPISSLEVQPQHHLRAKMVTFRIRGGRKDKVRAGDVLGALTGSNGLSGNAVGKIIIFDNLTYVAVKRELAPYAWQILSERKIKGRKFKVQQLH